LLGSAASIHLLLNGRITGISGILGGLVNGARDFEWRLAFAAGLLAGGMLINSFVKESFGSISLSLSGALISGFLVGFGTNMASGCTSGHGVCGVARFSLRSIVACIVFMSSGFATANWLNNNSETKQFLYAHDLQSYDNQLAPLIVPICTSICVLFLFGAFLKPKASQDNVLSILATFFCALLFSAGLSIGGVDRPETILGFVSSDNWTVLYVFGAAAGTAMIGFNLILNVFSAPLLMPRFIVPTNTSEITVKLIVGSLIFGIGWGVSGVCPGPGFAALASGDASKWVWNFALFSGFMASSRLTTLTSKIM